MEHELIKAQTSYIELSKAVSSAGTSQAKEVAELIEENNKLQSKLSKISQDLDNEKANRVTY